MSITAVCNSCGRRYQAPDNMAGKRVRCKQCGRVFEVPAPDTTGEPDLDTLGELEKSFAALDPSSMTTGTGAYQPPEAEGDDDASVAPLLRGRTNVRFRFSYAKEMDQYLPWILVIGGLIWLWMNTYRHNETGAIWVAIVRFVVAFLAYALIVAPVTLALIRKAGRTLGYQMPVGDRWRGFATYLPAFVFGIVMWVVGDGWITALVLGSLMGVTLMTGPLWLLFRLRPSEILMTAIHACFGFMLGLGIAGGVFFGLNALAVNLLVATKKPALLPGSPFSSGFAWIAPEVKEQLAGTNSPRPRPRTTTSPIQANDPEPVPPPPANNPTVVPQPAGPQLVPPAINSPIVRGVDMIPVAESFDEVIRPLTQSPFIAVVRRSGGSQTFELWNIDTRDKRGSAVFSVADSTRYVLSPDGDQLARIASFPRLELQIWSFAQSSIVRRIELNANQGTPELIGFANDLRLMIRWQRENACGIEVADLSGAAESSRKIETPWFERDSNTLVVSPDGRLVAIATKINNAPTLAIYDLESGMMLCRERINMDAPGAVLPTGIAFSFDARKIGILFEERGSGLLLCYAIDRAAGTCFQVTDQFYPAGPLPGRNARVSGGSALAWLPDGKSLVIYGVGVFDQASGRLIADVGLPSVETYRVVSPDTIEVVGEAPPNPGRQITLLRLDMAEISKRSKSLQ